MRRVLLASLVLGWISACHCGAAGSAGAAGGANDGEEGCDPNAQALIVTPSDQSAEVTQNGGTFSFTAEASPASTDVSRSVTWSVSRDDDSPAGVIDNNGVFTPPDWTGGQFTIKASDGCVAGQTTLTVLLRTTFGNPDPATVTRFDAGGLDLTTAARLPRIVYPQDETRFPRNIYKVLFQWQKAGNTQFRLTFQGPYSTTVVFTEGIHPNCANSANAACWEADTTTWQAIAGSNAGAITQLTVDGMKDGESTVYRAASIDLGFSKRDVRGAIFYWSTTAAGIRRASISDSAPESYLVGKPVPTMLPNDNGAVKCVACHTVSRSGKKLFAYTEAGTKGEFVYDVTLQSPPTPVITTQIGTQRGFGTFRPDDERVVATVGDLLAEFDANSGAKIVDLPAEGTNPDWSPLGTELVYSDVGGDSPGNASLKVIDYSSGGWGAIRMLAAADTKTNIFPSYSPDGRYVAYARGKGGHGDNTLQLFLKKADGSEAAVELLNANRSVNNCLGVVCDASGRTNGQYENNMPTWAPPGDLNWVAFNSRRPYGVVYPNGDRQQIWVAAIDPSKLGAVQSDGGVVDPSYPAFRFAFQDLAENNHRAFWTLDVRAPDPDTCVASGGTCTANTVCCQGLTCQAASTSSYTCQPPQQDAGVACLSSGTACSQTGGAPCCEGTFCDLASDGSPRCLAPTIN